MFWSAYSIFIIQSCFFATDSKIRYDNRDYKPRLQNNTAWECSNPEIEFSVTNGDCFGKMKSDKKTVNVRVAFDPGTSTGITVDDYDAVELNQHNGSNCAIPAPPCDNVPCIA